MKKILIGTTNLDQFNQYKDLLKDYPLEVVSLYDLKIPEPKSTGKDFEENAVLKARHYFQKSGIPTLSEDSGFEIEALKGAPGVKSSRWVSTKNTDEDLIGKVYKELGKAKTENRKCRMRTALAIASPFGVITAEGSLEGVVAEAAAQKRLAGNPYHSVMYFPNYEKYFCDLSGDELEILDHRKAAVEKIKDILHELSK